MQQHVAEFVAQREPVAIGRGSWEVANERHTMIVSMRDAEVPLTNDRDVVSGVE